MQDKFANIHHAAICTGCCFSIDVAGLLTCQKFRNGNIMMSCEDVTPDMCDRLTSTVISQLKLQQTKIGMGFLMEPSEDDPGEAKVMLVGSAGIVHKCSLSELFPEETFAVFPSMRIFNKEGEDITATALKAFLQKIYEAAPLSASAPFASLLDVTSTTIGDK